MSQDKSLVIKTFKVSELTAESQNLKKKNWETQPPLS